MIVFFPPSKFKCSPQGTTNLYTEVAEGEAAWKQWWETHGPPCFNMQPMEISGDVSACLRLSPHNCEGVERGWGASPDRGRFFHWKVPPPVVGGDIWRDKQCPLVPTRAQAWWGGAWDVFQMPPTPPPQARNYAACKHFFFSFLFWIGLRVRQKGWSSLL